MPLREQYFYRLSPRQKEQLTEPYASDVHVASPRPGPYAYTLMFHEAFGFQKNQALVLNPSVSDRLRRGRLILEETIETLTKGLGLTLALCNDGEVKNSHIRNGCEYVTMDVGETGWPLVILVHEEGGMYDPIETADGIGDINVVANGTAIEFGIPMPSIDHEIFCSNMTKLVDGKPILNRCKHWQDPGAEYTDETRAHCQHQLRAIGQGLDFGPLDCHEPSHLIDPTAPVGKGLKPDTYTPANIARVLQTHVEQFGVEK